MEQKGQRVPFSPLFLPRAHTRTLPNCPRNILPQRSVPATTHLHGDVRVRLCQSSSSRVPHLSALAFTPGTVSSVGSYQTCPEPSGIFPDQGLIENTLSPASLAGGFFTTGPPGREVPSQPSKIIYPETVHVVLQIIGPSGLK